MVSSPPGSLVQRTCGTPRSGSRRSPSPPRPRTRATACRTTRRRCRLLDRRHRREQRLVPRQRERRLHRRPLVGERSGPITSTSGCEPAIRINDPEHGDDADLHGDERRRNDVGDNEDAQGRCDALRRPRSRRAAPEPAGWYRSAVIAQVERYRRDLRHRLVQPAVDVQRPGRAPRSSRAEPVPTTPATGPRRRADSALRLDTACDVGRAQPGAEHERLAEQPRPGRLERLGCNLADRVLRQPEQLQRPRHQRHDIERGLHRQGRKQVDRELRGQVRHAPTGDERCPQTRAADSAGWYPDAGDDRGQRAPTRSRASPSSCTSTTYGGPDTSGTSKSVTCTDGAGNSSSERRTS